MTRQQQNDILIQYIDSELRDTPNIGERVGNAFNRWFQQLLQMAAPPPPAAAPTEEEVSG